MMSRRIPIVSRGKKICIICEGDEEVDYLNKLISLTVWNKSLNIILMNAMGNGNITARYQDAFQNSEYDMVFAFVDTDRVPHEKYKDIKRKIDDIYGIEGASNEVVIFGNPCTMQIIILHFEDIKLTSHQKKRNKPIIEKCTGINSYNANKKKRDSLFGLINKDNYEIMKERLKLLSSGDTQKNSSNFLRLLNWFSDDNLDWITELESKLDL